LFGSQIQKTRTSRYNLIKFISNSEIDDKKFYTDILRAQLSSHELLLLHYNSQSNYGKKILHYLSEFNLLKHLPEGEKIEILYLNKREKEKKADG
jgi:hypothetical protein